VAVPLAIAIASGIASPVLSAHPEPAADAARNAAPPITSKWSWNLETAYLPHTIENPLFGLFGITPRDNARNPNDYQLATLITDAVYDIGEPSGWRFLRGYWQSSFGVIYSAILKGPETHFVGVLSGMRYNFVAEGSRWAPYAQMRFGAGVVDSSGHKSGQKQDFTFTYLMDLGLRYTLKPGVAGSAGAGAQHRSDFYQTDKNTGFDTLGFTIRTEMRF